MEEIEFPCNIEDLIKLCSEHLVDIAQCNTELYPDLMIEYRDIDGRKGWAYFGEFFFYDGECFLLKKGKLPKNKRLLNVLNNVFHDYYASHNRLSREGCIWISLYAIRTKEECELVKSLAYYYPEDIHLFDKISTDAAFNNGNFEYFFNGICKRSLPEVREAFKQDRVDTIFEFLKYSTAFDLTWRMLVRKKIDTNAELSYEICKELRDKIISTYIMPFERKPFQNYNTKENEPIITYILDEIKFFFSNHEDYDLDGYWKYERTLELWRLSKNIIK